MTKAEAKADFARQWPSHPRPADVVAFEHFAAYYADVAACVPAGTDVPELVANAWHVPGAGSWVVKKGKRVLVTFHKGSSTEAVIPAGEDIADDDQAALANALEKMKIGGVARVKVLGLVEPSEE